MRCVTVQEVWTLLIVTLVLYASLDLNEVLEKMLLVLQHWAVCLIISPMISIVLLIGPMSAMALGSGGLDPPLIMSVMEVHNFVLSVLASVKAFRELLWYTV